ncbi:TetR family transcriptional regulator [Krasilnikovia cinnamomea]|uniref:TetR family transcriptional regulator n=1 Tax=Krasilnikovia cinnamomea TaxID=349313 RepID=A0A4Q7ZLF2_9ACTN|nr:TetR/AcrR family transcriptional regulator [Krasilnikovia cinnamomea]RZU51792.1 TetR family transcriptional regulator [Krasilnikovia cinnamomea]
MSSARAAEDLTARARIRDAAIDLFAEHGFAAATVRDIAQRAGVSSGLLRHHFGSKEGLRDACDEYAMARMSELRDQLFGDGHIADQNFLPSVHPETMRLQAYLVRSMMEGATTAMFERMVEAGEAWLAGVPVRTDDPRAFAAVIAAMKLGMFLLRDQLSHVLGGDVAEPAGHGRMLRAAIDIFAQPLLTADQADQARAALEEAQTP